MAGDKDARDEPRPGDEHQFSRFEDLTRKLLTVPKSEVDELRKDETDSLQTKVSRRVDNPYMAKLWSRK